MNQKILYCLLFSLDILLCSGQDLKEKDDRTFSLDYNDGIIRIKGDDLQLDAAFKEPEMADYSFTGINWKLSGSETSSMVFGNEEGKLRTDIYVSSHGRLEQRTWISRNKGLVAFQHIYTNSSKMDTRLKALYPFHLTGENKIFSGKGACRVLTQDTQKNGIPGTTFPSDGKSIKSDPFLIINDSIENENLFVGSQTFYLHLFEINLEFNEGPHQGIKSLECKCDFGGVTVSPGSSRESQWIIMEKGKDPYKLITDFTGRTSFFHHYKKPAPIPPSVYSAFYYHGLSYNEEYFKTDIAAFRKDHMPFDVFQIDACWQQNYGHDFEYDKKAFPSGMKWAAEQIASLDYIPGIWTAPYIVKIKSETSLAKTHPEWLLKNSKGVLCTWIDSYYILDPTYPGVTDYLERSYHKLASDWGYKYFKFDFMRTIFMDADQQFYDRNATSLEAYRKGLEAIRKGVGENAYILVCGGHYGASLGIADGQRSGSDTRSFWNEKELPKYRQNILRTWMSDLWNVDPDAMMIRRQAEQLEDGGNLTLGLFNDDEARTNTLNQFLGGSLVCFAEDFSVIDPDRKSLYRHVIPSINSPSKPLDIFNLQCPNLMLTHVIPVCKDLPEWNILSVVNWSDNPKSYDIKIDEKVLGELKGNKFIISEFFSQEVLGVFRKDQPVKLENVLPHQSRILRIMPWNGKDAVLAGTDLHFSGGGVEIKQWKNTGEKIEGIINTRWNYPVLITVILPAKNNEGFKSETIRLSAGQKNFTLTAK